MVFPVSQIKGMPQYDGLPVAKVLDYPLEKRDYKPYAQNQICLGEGSLHVRMWAFEVSPLPTSRMTCVMGLFPKEPEKAVGILVEMGEEGKTCTALFLLEAGREVPGSRLDFGEYAHPFGGEDLQGVYWGAEVRIPLNRLLELGAAIPAIGESVPGNFYKLSDAPGFCHRGSWHPAQFTGEPFGRESMGSFRIVAY